MVFYTETLTLTDLNSVLGIFNTTIADILDMKESNQTVI